MLNRFLCVLMMAISAIASQAYEIKATATDSVGEPLPYVTYRIFQADGDTELKAGITDELGAFTQQLDSAAHYRLELSYTGMATLEKEFEVDDTNPVADLGMIVLREGTQMLQSVTVTAQRPLVVKQIDRIGYDVQADPDTPTSNLNDILRKVPMVSVDPDGTIKVNGSTDFKIYKNGRPNNSMSRNAKDLFAALPASMIKRIEVITEPGAEYDAEGTSAILNIITDNNSSIKGVLGSVSAHWSTDNDIPGLNTWVTTEIDKVTMNVYGGYQNIGGRRTRSSSESETVFDDGTSRRSTGSSRMKGNLGYFGLDGSYQPDTLNLFTAELGGYAYDASSTDNSFNPTFDADGNIVNSYRTVSDNPYSRYTDIDANFNYQRSTHRKGENITLSYMLSHTNESSHSQSFYSDVQGMTLPYSAILSKYKLSFFEHTAQLDWSRPMGIHTLNFGAKGIFRRNHSTNSFEYVGMETRNDEFSHVTDIAAIYGQYSVKLKKVSLRAGLRYEYSHLKASYPDGSHEPFSSDLNDVVPSAAASWQVNDANSLSFNYSTSISRPGISYLNPAVTISPTTINYGNPDLGSARRQSMKLSYTLIKPKINLQLAVNYDFTNNGVAAFTFVDDNNIINSTYFNIGHTRNLNFSGYTQWTITGKTRLMINASVRYQRASQNGMRLSRWQPHGYMQLRQQLPWKLNGEIYCFYSNGWMSDVYSYSNSSFMSSFYYGLSLNRAFLKGDRLNVRLNLDDPIAPSRRNYRRYTVNGDYRGWSNYFQPGGISFRISVSYRFGSLQAQVKKTAASIENDDLVGRKSN